MSSNGIERSPFDAKPLNADEYRDLLTANSSLVLRVSDGTGDGTYRFWVENGDLYWRCLNWGAPQQSDQVHLEAVLDNVPGDATTQLLIERTLHTDMGRGSDE